MMEVAVAVLPEQHRALPRTLRVAVSDHVAELTLARPEKRNALDDATVLGLETFFTTLDPQVRAVVLTADGDHFCAGLNLGEMTARDAMAGIAHSRMWHGSSPPSRVGACR